MPSRIGNKVKRSRNVFENETGLFVEYLDDYHEEALGQSEDLSAFEESADYRQMNALAFPAISSEMKCRYLMSTNMAQNKTEDHLLRIYSYFTNSILMKDWQR